MANPFVKEIRKDMLRATQLSKAALASGNTSLAVRHAMKSARLARAVYPRVSVPPRSGDKPKVIGSSLGGTAIVSHLPRNAKPMAVAGYNAPTNTRSLTNLKAQMSTVVRQATTGNSPLPFSARANTALNNANLRPNDRAAQIRAAKIMEGAANRVNRFNPASKMGVFVPGKEGIQSVPTSQRYAQMAGEHRSRVTSMSTVPHSQFPKVQVVAGTENKPMDPFPKAPFIKLKGFNEKTLSSDPNLAGDKARFSVAKPALPNRIGSMPNTAYNRDTLRIGIKNLKEAQSSGKMSITNGITGKVTPLTPARHAALLTATQNRLNRGLGKPVTAPVTAIPHSQFPKVQVVAGTENKPMDPFPKAPFIKLKGFNEKTLSSDPNLAGDKARFSVAKPALPNRIGSMPNTAYNRDTLRIGIKNLKEAQSSGKMSITNGITGKVTPLTPARHAALLTATQNRLNRGLGKPVTAPVTARLEGGTFSRGFREFQAAKARGGGGGGGQPRVPAGSSAGGQFARK